MGGQPEFAGLGDRVFFRAHSPTHGTELWSSDGTAAGTQLVADIMPGIFGAEPHGMAAVNGWMVFSVDDGRS